MRLAIMQPYFFPYLGYFSLLAVADQFVVFDPVQYIRHGWINRNRILKPDFCQPQYVGVPVVKHSRETTIREIRISSNQQWRERIKRQLDHYRRRANNFAAVESILNRCFALNTDRIVELNVHCLKIICEYLEIEFKPLRFDELENCSASIKHPGDWAFEIARAMDATTYINPIGGREIFDEHKFQEAGINLEFLQNRLVEYPQCNSSFVPGLSILDVLMFNDRIQAKQLVHDFEVVQPNHGNLCTSAVTRSARCPGGLTGQESL